MRNCTCCGPSGVLGSLHRPADPARRRRPYRTGRNRDRNPAHPRPYPWFGLLPAGRAGADRRYSVRVRLRALATCAAAIRSRLYQSLRRLGERLPGGTLIRPGHNYGITPTSTMIEQLAGNPFLHFDDGPGFVEYRMHLHDREEPYQPESRPASPPPLSDSRLPPTRHHISKQHCYRWRSMHDCQLHRYADGRKLAQPHAGGHPTLRDRADAFVWLGLREPTRN